jgi:transposase
VRVTSQRNSSHCPLCSTPSFAIHSSYRRKSLDLPCAGRPIRLLLTVKKFFCRVATCSRKIFTERLPDLIAVSSRLTTRLRTAVQETGFASCGKGGEGLASKLGITVSDAALLRSMLLLPLPIADTVKIVGIDDWAWRRGHRYGTIIVDLQTHRVIDLLPDRTAASVKLWLEAHPHGEIAGRDRGNTYIDGATQGAPLARQVCDRRHLGLDRKTIRKYLKAERPLHPRQKRRQASILDPYYEYILTRWEQGCHNGQLLLKEVRAQGYPGGDSLVRALVARLRKQLPVRAPVKGSPSASIRTIPASPRELRWVLAKQPEELEAEEQADLERLLQVSQQVRMLHTLLQSFLRMVGERRPEDLPSWLLQAEQSQIPEIKNFAGGIERDRAAVEAALRLPWSQGPVEGNVNRLKTLKRQMYGKAGFELLRQRVLHRG